MNKYLKVDPWKIVEQGFDPEKQRSSESIFSLGNGHMGQRANFEEQYSGETLQGSYIGGIYYPDKTKVGWWKNGYPEYFAKVLNSVNWIGIDIKVNDQRLDLAECEVLDFERVLDMKKGLLKRTFTARLENGNEIEVNIRRFLSMKRSEVGAIEYEVKALNFDGTITFGSYLNGEVYNEDSNYDEIFWAAVDQELLTDGAWVTTKTKKLDFHVCAGMKCELQKNDESLEITPDSSISSMKVEQSYEVPVSQDDSVTFYKYAGVASSFNHERKRLHRHIEELTKEIAQLGFEQLLHEQADSWQGIWDRCDIKIEGDDEAQQGIRFNIYQLYQTYTGEDERLNIGPKGFTGEKYGGATYWDTEAYCLPFYLCTAGPDVAKKLLQYRYRHLSKAIENAQKLGFENGAALYPMVTMNGEECHNEWEITFEEIHRNGAIVYAIYNYIRHTGDDHYLKKAGLEVMIAISRFWSQRFQYSEHKDQFVMLGVTGPNEYENNVNNNWYTNYIACWTFRYTLEAIEWLKNEDSDRWNSLCETTGFDPKEINRWKDILENIYYPEDENRGIFLQQDGFLDKDLQPADTLDSEERPINQHWSWDRILRSCYIKQGDVLQGLYFFDHEFDDDTIRCNFDFYEPLTVHESSLSPCIHSILASQLRYADKAYELYLRTARLDLDDYNQEVHQGLHITSMAGTWMTIVEGFAGKRIEDGELYLSPSLPKQWEAYSFNFLYRGRTLKVRVSKEQVTVCCEEGEELKVHLFDKSYNLSSKDPLIVKNEVISQ